MMKRSASPHPDQQPSKKSLPTSPNGHTSNTSPQQRSSPRSLRDTPLTRVFKGCPRKDDFEYDEIKDKLGEGTFGEVFKATRKLTNEKVALKLILMQNEKEGFPITALREIKILKSLEHNNIVPLIDVAVSPGNKQTKENAKIYMVFPYMDHDLSGLLENPAVKFTVPQIKWYMKQLLEGTLYLHSNKILHRDMKAANLLINNAGILKIADFGLARAYIPDDPKRDYTVHVVTRWYRPPELLLGERKYTTAIDMWGVGCVFAEILKGKPILQGTTDLDQLGKIWVLCGAPTDETMPGWRNLPGMEHVKSFPYFKRRIREDYKQYGDEAVSLLDGLLTLDPAKRLTASQALDHDYFWTDPMPSTPNDLPPMPSSHEYDRRKHRQPQDPPPRNPPAAPAHHHTTRYADGYRPEREESRRRDDNNGWGITSAGGGDYYAPNRDRDKDSRRDRDKERERDRDRDRDSRDRERDRDNRDRDRGDRDREREREPKERMVHPLPPKPSNVVLYK